MLQDLLHLVCSIVWLGGEGALRHLDPQDVFHHVGSEPPHQRRAARGVVSLTVVEQQPIHLESEVMCVRFSKIGLCNDRENDIMMNIK